MSSYFKKEWIGASGYCNCILVMMSRIDIAKMELATNLPLPNLEDLAAPREATAAGVRAQEFPYASLQAKQGYRDLKHSAGMSRMSWASKTGKITVVDLLSGSYGMTT